MLNYRSYSDLSRDVAANIQKIPDIDIVVGIPKSGLIPAIMIASFKNRRFFDLDSFQFGFALRSGVRKYSFEKPEKLRVLVVDDSINTGAEFERTRRRLDHFSGEFDFTFCAVYGVGPALHSSADVVLSYVPHPRIFQWNYRNHAVAEHALFDMDGVLCVDPTDEENDDGERYTAFLETAQQLTIPTKVISGIVTSRLERYRFHTERWLERAGVRYRDLLMIDLPTAEERRRLRAHAPFKASVYKSRDEVLFVESNWKQALFIAAEANKPVICTENDIFIRDREAALELKAKGLPQIISHEIELERQISGLIDRLVETDPFAAYWLKTSRFKYDPSKLASVSPFLKSRIVTAGANHRLAPATIPVKSGSVRRILMISRTFDVQIGAGAAASSERLRNALKSSGVEVYTLALEDFPEMRDATQDQPIGGVRLGYWGNYADEAHSARVLGRIQQIDPDCIILGAIDRGILSPFDLARIPYPIVWVARDNWMHTGGCLFKLEPESVAKLGDVDSEFLEALSCEGFKTGCHYCPALKDPTESIKSRINFELKRTVLSYRKDIVFAPISEWMADTLREAPLTCAHTIKTVSNPIDLNVVRKLDSRPNDIRQRLGLNESDKLVLLAAHSISNPRKGLGGFLRSLFSHGPLDGVVFVQMGKDSVDIDVPDGHRIISLGYVSDELEKVKIYNEVDVTLVPALQESLSVVASDSLCCGTPVVAYRTSGLATIVAHRENGYLAEPFDPADIIVGLKWILQELGSRDFSTACITSAAELFRSSANVRSLLELTEVAAQQFRSLLPLPAEIEAISQSLNLLSEDIRVRSLRFRQMDRRRKDLESKFTAGGLKTLEDKNRELQIQLDVARGQLSALKDDLRRVGSDLSSTRERLEWNRKRRAELEEEVGNYKNQALKGEQKPIRKNPVFRFLRP